MKALRILQAAVACCLLSAVCHAQTTPRVRYALAAYEPGTTTRVTTLKAGDRFDLALCVQDIRTRPERFTGVWAAYCDVIFDKTLLTPDASSVKWENGYTNGARGDTSASFGIAAWGGFQGVTSGIGQDMLEVSRCRMTTKWPDKLAGQASTTVRFLISFRNVPHPACDTLMLVDFAAYPPESSEVAFNEIVWSVPSFTLQR